MRVLVTFAVDAEFAPWRSLRNFVRCGANDLELWNTEIESSEVTILLTGMGERASAQAMSALINGFAQDRSFDFCISSGLAGSLNESFLPGQVIAAEQIKSPTVHSDLGKNWLDADKYLVDLAVSNGAKKARMLFSADHVLTTSLEKKQMSAVADIVDMESFSIIKEGYAWGARGVAIRAISDGANEDMPIDFNRTISSNNGVSIPRVLAELAKNPVALPSLIQFGKRSQKAAESLARFLDNFILQLNNPFTVGPTQAAVMK